MVVHEAAAGGVAEAEHGSSVGLKLNVKAALVHLPLALVVSRSENTRSRRKSSDNRELGLSLTAGGCQSPQPEPKMGDSNSTPSVLRHSAIFFYIR